MAAPKRELFKSAEVCEVVQVQPYVLRSWEAEFPQIGQAPAAGGPRVYRRADIELVLRIKQLVFEEGLTLSGARHRLGDEETQSSSATDEEVEEVLEALASDARTRIARVRDGLRSILKVLSSAPGTVVIVDDEVSREPVRTPKRPAARGAAPAKRSVASRSKPRAAANASRKAKPTKKKRSRANA